jgi:hypothetical protein
MLRSVCNRVKLGGCTDDFSFIADTDVLF